MQTRKIRPGREPPGTGKTRPWGTFRGPVPATRTERDADRETRDADQAMTALYQAHYRPLVRLAALLVADLAAAEDIVQNSFAAVHEGWHALPDTYAALTFLRRSVIRQCRPAKVLPPGTGMPDGGRGTGLSLPGSAVVSALRALPARQREVMVLRYFAELPEAEIASVTGMSPAAVRTHLARALSALHAGLRPADD